jgi:hypothetical protein
MVRHFGMFQFKEGISPSQIDNCFAEMKGMVGKIPGLLAMEHGPYPEHERVRDIVVPCLERVVVFDFEI